MTDYFAYILQGLLTGFGSAVGTYLALDKVLPKINWLKKKDEAKT